MPLKYDPKRDEKALNQNQFAKIRCERIREGAMNRGGLKVLKERKKGKRGRKSGLKIVMCEVPPHADQHRGRTCRDREETWKTEELSGREGDHSRLLPSERKQMRQGRGNNNREFAEGAIPLPTEKGSK